MRALILSCLLVLVAPAFAQSAPRWPYQSVQLGLEDGEGAAAALQSSAPMGFRYHYLAGGVNTSETWQKWGQGNGSFVRTFIDDSAAHGFVPAFTYYELRQSEPGRSTGDEEAAVVQNLQDRETMRAYFADLERFFEVAASTGKTTLLHVEPDAWGYLQRRAGNDARSLHVELPGESEPNTVAGFAQRIVKLRDRVAPRVLLGYHVSIWGTGKDIAVTDEPDHVVDALAKQAAEYRKTLGAPFDVTFFETTDRDAGYAQNRDGQSAQIAWWNDADYTRLARFIAGFRSRVGAPVVLWQVPLGNQRMRAMNNSAHHYQDNKVETLLDDPKRTRLRELVRAGVVAVLFGAGQSESTCACDAAQDGVTNPSPVTGNTRVSRSSDDDGGLFRELATRYRRQGAIQVAARVRAPTRAKGGGGSSRAGSNGAIGSSGSSFSTRASATRVNARRFAIKVSARSQVARTGVLSIEVYRDGTKVFQRFRQGLRFRAGRVRSFAAQWPIPLDGSGTYTVKVGVFGPGWNPLLHWNDAAAVLRV